MSALVSVTSQDRSHLFDSVPDLSAEALTERVVGWDTLYRSPCVTAPELLSVVMQLDLPLSGYFAVAAAIVEGGDAHALQLRRDKVTRYDEGHIFYNTLRIIRMNHELRNLSGRTNPGAVAQYLRFPSHSSGILGLEKTTPSLLTGILHDVHEDARVAYPSPETLCDRLLTAAEQLREQCGFKREDLPPDYYTELRRTIEEGVFGAWILAKYDPDLFPHETAEERKSRSRELYRFILLEHPHLLLPKLSDVWSNLRSDMPKLKEDPLQAAELYRQWHGKLQIDGYASFRDLALSIYGPHLEVVEEIDEMLNLICSECVSTQGSTGSAEELLKILLRSDILDREERIEPDFIRVLKIAESRKNLYLSEEQHLLTNYLARLISSGCLYSLRDKQPFADLLIECLKSSLRQEAWEDSHEVRSSRDALLSIFESYCRLEDEIFRQLVSGIVEWAEALGMLNSRIQYLSSLQSDYLEEALRLEAPFLSSVGGSNSIEMRVADYLRGRISSGQSASNAVDFLCSEFKQTDVVLDQVATRAEKIRRSNESPRFRIPDTVIEAVGIVRTCGLNSLCEETLAELRDCQRNASYWSGEPFLLQWMFFRAEQLFGKDNFSTFLLASYYEEPQAETIFLETQSLRERWPESLEECYLRGTPGSSKVRLPRELALIVLPGHGWTEEELHLRLHETALTRGPKNEPKKAGKAPTSALRDEIGLILKKTDLFSTMKQLFGSEDLKENTVILPELEYIALSQITDLRAMVDSSKRSGEGYNPPRSSAYKPRVFSGAFDHKGETYIQLRHYEERVPYLDQQSSRIVALEATGVLNVAWEEDKTGIVVLVKTTVISIVSSNDVTFGPSLHTSDSLQQDLLCDIVQRIRP